MDISTEQFDSKMNQPNFLSKLIQILNDIARLMIEFLRVTDEDRIAAGIRTDCEKYENRINFHP
jgi:hypothetical protein